MAGVKGMKGGGGARKGAGRKPKPPAVVAVPAAKVAPKAAAGRAPKEEPKSPPVLDGVSDPLVFLRMAWTGLIDASPTQVRAAASALPFVHTRLGEGGKKEQRQEDAKKVAGRFSAGAPPKLVAAGGRKV